MRVKDLQLFLSKFTESDAGGRQGNAISNAVIFVEKDGHLHEIKRMEVHEHAVPIIGHIPETLRKKFTPTMKHGPWPMDTGPKLKTTTGRLSQASSTKLIKVQAASIKPQATSLKLKATSHKLPDP